MLFNELNESGGEFRVKVSVSKLLCKVYIAKFSVTPCNRFGVQMFEKITMLIKPPLDSKVWNQRLFVLLME